MVKQNAKLNGPFQRLWNNIGAALESRHMGIGMCLGQENFVSSVVGRSHIHVFSWSFNSDFFTHQYTRHDRFLWILFRMYTEMIPVFRCRQRKVCSCVVDLNIVLEGLHQNTHDNLNKEKST